MIAALTGGVVTTAVNIPAISPADMEVLGPFVPLCRQLGRLAVALAEGSSVDRVEVEFLGRIGERDTRLLSVAVLMGVLRRPHRGGRQRGQRARASPRSAGSRSARRSARPRATSPTSCA